MIRSLLGMAAATTMLCAGLSIPASADDAKRVFRDGLPAKYAKRVEAFRSGFLALDNSDAAKGVYDTAEMWGPEITKLRVCFFEGSKETRAAIAKIATEWADKEMGVTLDFGKMSNPRMCDANSNRPNHIRVGFRQPGYWSTVGQGSVIYAKPEEQSMNFEDFDKIPADQLATVYDGYAKGTIVHEFGHAMGFQHEHQSPAGNCDAEYDWSHIYEYMAGPPNNWPKEQVDYNMRMATQPTLMMTNFDPEFGDALCLSGRFLQERRAVSLLPRTAEQQHLPVRSRDGELHVSERSGSSQATLCPEPRGLPGRSRQEQIRRRLNEGSPAGLYGNVLRPEAVGMKMAPGSPGATL